MKKITFITMQLKTSGGIERFVTTLANGLVDDYEIEVVANYGKSGDKLFFDLSDKISVKYLYPTQPKEISLKKLLRERQFWQIAKEPKRRFLIKHHQARVFKKYLKSLKTDFIITERSTYNRLVGKYYRGKAKLIATDHNFHQYQKSYINDLFSSIKGFNNLIVSTTELSEYYKDKVLPVKVSAINIPLPFIPDQKTDFSQKNIIAVGRVEPEKDFAALIRVMERVHQKDPSIKLFLIGTGKELPDIKRLVKEKGLEKCIILTGELAQDEICNYFYKSSVFVLTSKTEAFGLVIAEAMSFGLPVIAFDRASGARAQISNSTGILIPNADEDLMAQKIVDLINNQKQLLLYQKSINSAINNYSTEYVIKEWKKLLS